MDGCSTHQITDDQARVGVRSAAGLFVWGIWGLMLVGNLTLVLRYTGPYPHADDLYLLSGSEATISLPWLWEQYAEHRVPLAKLVWLGVLKLSGYDFRAGNVLSVLSVAATAAALVIAAGKLRGRARFTDAFFPLTMLGFGQMQNFLWWWVFNHILPHLIACVLLLVIAFRGREPRLRDTLLVAVLLGLLFLSGPGGLPYLLTFAAWLGYRAVLLVQSTTEPNGRRDGLITLGLAVVSLAMAGLYFIGYRVEPGKAAGITVPEMGMAEEVKASLRLLAVSFGPVVTPYLRPLVVILLGLSLAGTSLAIRAWIREPGERPRAAGLLLFLAAAAALLFAVGRARAGFGWEYLLGGVHLNLAIPALCAIYLIGILYGKPAIGELMQATLFTLACFFFLPNYERAVAHGRGRVDSQQAIIRDIEARVPISILTERCHDNFGFSRLYNHTYFPYQVQVLSQLLQKLKGLGLPQFRDLAADPDFREEAIPVTPSALGGAASEDGVAFSCSRIPGDAALLYDLDRPRFVYAIRLTCSYEGDGMAELRIAWGTGDPTEGVDGGGPGEAGGERLWVSTKPPWISNEPEDRPHIKTAIFWVNSEIDRFRIHPDTKAFAFRLSKIELLVP